MAESLTPDEPYQPALSEEDAEEVLGATNGNGRNRLNVDARMSARASTAERDEIAARAVIEATHSYQCRLLEIADRWDRGEQPTEEQIEFICGRGAMEVLIDPASKPVFKAKSIDQMLRVREKRLLAKELKDQKNGSPPKPAITLPGSSG